MNSALTLRQRLESRVAAWARRRQGEDILPLAIARRRVYILPTRAGIGFAVLLFGMLLAGLNYGNALALFLTFTLVGVALVAMHQCHRNLLGIALTAASAGAVFAGERARLELALGNPGRLRRFAVQAAVATTRGAGADLEPDGSARLGVLLATTRRGRVPIDRVRLSTEFPFGLFEAWTWLHLSLELIVYPVARGEQLPPEMPAARAGERAVHGPGDDEWAGLRAFRAGDSPRQVAWKAYARGAPLLVKEYASSGAAERLFDYGSLTALAPEARLEQLCRWIVDADARGDRFGLRLPDLSIATGQGLAHRERCLRALAVFGEPAGGRAG
jgi:uncharacterized protein (DUF58 family)